WTKQRWGLPPSSPIKFLRDATLSPLSMEFQLPISIPSLPQPIRYEDKVLLTGSCFTEHIGNALQDWKFDTLQNPNGILFDPASVATSLVSYIQPKIYTE